MNKKILGSAIVLAFAAAGVTTSANAALAANSVLTFNAGVTSCAVPLDSYGGCNAPEVLSGSYFGMDTNGNGSIASTERTAISVNNGIVLGTAQAASGSHAGVPNGSENEGIDNAWNFFGNTGMHYSATPVTVISSAGNTASLNFSGWGVTWNGIPAINMGSGAFSTSVSGVAAVTCGVDCAVGDTYTLVYRATVPLGDPSNFGGVRYILSLTGTVAANPIPVPAAAWLFGSGLLGLAGVARRRKAA